MLLECRLEFADLPRDGLAVLDVRRPLLHPEKAQPRADRCLVERLGLVGHED